MCVWWASLASLLLTLCVCMNVYRSEAHLNQSVSWPQLKCMCLSVPVSCLNVRGDSVLCTAAIEGDKIVKAVSTIPAASPHLTCVTSAGGQPQTAGTRQQTSQDYHQRALPMETEAGKEWWCVTGLAGAGELY